MKEVIRQSQKLIQECKSDLEELSCKKVLQEGEVRRAKILLSNRVLMLEESKLEVQKLCEEESFFKSRINDSL